MVDINDIIKLYIVNFIILGQMASDILCCHYGTLAQSLQYPFKVAQLLCGERVISKTTLAIMENEQWPQSEEKTIFVLLRAV